MSTFGGQMQTITEDTKLKLRDLLQKTALDAFSEVVLMSPVKSGRFRGNWLPAIGAAPGGYDWQKLDPDGSETIARASATVEASELGDTIYLVNNLPYARRLEEGWSKRAPAGMVRITAARWQPIVRKVAAVIVAGN